MSYLQLVPDEHIEKLEQEEQKRFHNMLDAHIQSKDAAWETRERWLAIYARCLSPSIACKQADVSIEAYRRWRKTDPRFCRELNKVIEEAHENMVGSAYARATGYLQADPDTESGFQEDATGRPIRHGMSDRLAIALIAGKERVSREAPRAVSININLRALGIEEEEEAVQNSVNVTPLRLPSPVNGEVVDGECEEHDGDPQDAA